MQSQSLPLLAQFPGSALSGSGWPEEEAESKAKPLLREWFRLFLFIFVGLVLLREVLLREQQEL